MSGEPNAAEIIQAGKRRYTTRGTAKGAGKAEVAPESDDGLPVPVTTPETPVEAKAEVVSGEPETDSPAETLERLGVSAEAASEAVAAIRRMWGK